jgi:predicted RNase H-like HicB family nuclease
MDTFKAFIKRIASYSKSDWDFDDYPAKTWKNPNAGEENVAYGAGIINWTMMVAHGETKEKAMTALKESFKLYKENNNDLPRPGTKVPLQFASTDNIDKYEQTAVDFFKRVLNMDYYEGFYSDGSVLEFLRDDDTDSEGMKKEIIRRTLSMYNVDITDIYDEPLWTIFERIENRG